MMIFVASILSVLSREMIEIRTKKSKNITKITFRPNYQNRPMFLFVIGSIVFCIVLGSQLMRLCLVLQSDIPPPYANWEGESFIFSLLKMNYNEVELGCMGCATGFITLSCVACVIKNLTFSVRLSISCFVLEQLNVILVTLTVKVSMMSSLCTSYNVPYTALIVEPLSFLLFIILTCIFVKNLMHSSQSLQVSRLHLRNLSQNNPVPVSFDYPNVTRDFWCGLHRKLSLKELKAFNASDHCFNSLFVWHGII